MVLTTHCCPPTADGQGDSRAHQRQPAPPECHRCAVLQQLIPAAVLALQVLKRAPPARGAPSRSASFEPQAEEKRRYLYTRLRNTVAGMASAAVGRARAAFWATRLPIAKEAAAQVANEPAAQKSGSPQAGASRATIRHRQLLDQLGLSQREMPSDGKCFVSHPH